MSDLVGNPEDRFSRVAAHIPTCPTSIFKEKRVARILYLALKKVKFA